MDDTPPLEATWTLFTHKQSLSNNYSAVYDEAIGCSTIGFQQETSVPGIDRTDVSESCHHLLALMTEFDQFDRPAQDLFRRIRGKP